MNTTLPSRRARTFMAPVWMMGGIVVVRLFLMANTLWAMRQLQMRQGAGINKFALLPGLTLILIATVEAIVYWRIRRTKYNQARARAHLLLMLVSMIVLPLLFILFSRIARLYLNSNHFVELIQTFGKLQFYIFWLCFITGTILFISIAVKASLPAEEKLEDMIDAIGED